MTNPPTHQRLTARPRDAAHLGGDVIGGGQVENPQPEEKERRVVTNRPPHRGRAVNPR